MDTLQTQIIYRYKKIFTFFFHYFIFLLAIGGIFLLFQRIILQSASIQIFQTNDVFLLQKTKLIAEFSKFLKQNIKDNDVNIYVLQGDFQTKQWFITSVNNLIGYKGFVLPRYFYMYTTIPVKQLYYFSGDAYDINELENFVNTFIFTKKTTLTKPFTRVQLPLTTSLRDDFNLACIFENKFSTTTCNYYLNTFLDSFFVYTLSADYDWLKKIFDATADSPTQKGKFCEGLSKYLLYSNDYSTPIEWIFDLCGTIYQELFKKTTLFMEIQTTLENQTFDKITYKDATLNSYKLFSYQQQIYQDFLINKADTYKITMYLDFVRELLKKSLTDQFHKEEIYRYNNKYLSLALEKLAYQSTLFTQNFGGSKITSLLTMIATLNEWEPMLWFTGLISEIINKKLIPTQEMYTWSNPTTSIAEKIQTKLKNIAYLTIEKQSISETIVDIIGYLSFTAPDTKKIIKSHIIMQYTNDLLLIKSIELQNNPEINEVIKNLLIIQNFALGELYSYIAKNLVFYGQENIPTTIDLCPVVEALKDITIITCTPTAVTIDNNNIRYKFTIKNWGIEQVSLSDISLENSIKASYSTIIKDKYTLTDTIQAIIEYKAPVAWHEWTTNAIMVFEKIQQYLGIKANDIADSSGKILVDISLGGINFIANYSLSTSTLWPWYFKDIQVNNKPYMIQNLNLPLDDPHQNSINTFVIDPLNAIKTVDFTARQNYNEFKKQ